MRRMKLVRAWAVVNCERDIVEAPPQDPPRSMPAIYFSREHARGDFCPGSNDRVVEVEIREVTPKPKPRGKRKEHK